MPRKQKAVIAVGLTAAAALVLSACSSSKKATTTPTGSESSTGSSGGAAAFNAATTSAVNPSTKAGGTLNLTGSGDCDSWDPVDTYVAACWNMQRLFTRTLVGYSSTPGKVGIEADLATALGEHNADFTEWSYTLKDGLKYENGNAITADDIKYGIERIFDTADFQQGPSSYYLCLLDKCDADGNPTYKGPYKSKTGLTQVTTSGNKITFKLNTSTPDFDYLMALPAAAPVPATENGSFKGTTYKNHPLSSGPYKFDSYTPEQKVVWVRNDQWSQATDTIRKPLVDKIVLTISSNQDDNDKALLAGTQDAPFDGGVATAAQTQIVTDEAKKKQADDPITAFTRYLAIFPQTKPFDNIHCRKAVAYALNKADLQKARGGSYGGAIATTMAPPAVPGSDPNANPYPSGPDNTGDLTKAKDELTQCGQPNGFDVKMAYRNNSSKNINDFGAVQQALARVGIKVTGLPHGATGYYGGYIGKPDTVKTVGIGLADAGWGPDFPTGAGFWNSIAASNAPPGGGNYYQLKDPKIDDLLKQASASTGTHDDLYKALDAQFMSDAVAIPFVWDKTLFYRNPRMTNVYNNTALGGYYDFVNIGVS
jgi:peptide/nickel transport system substrate-binding protein